MIKFFRIIRRNLVSEGKTGKPAYRTGRYLKYALGEIILVMIGILLALQVNNWNENRKLDAKVQDYYRQLLEDLNKDRDYTNSIIAKFEAQRKIYRSYLNRFDGPTLTRKVMYQDLLKLNMESYAINFNTSTFESLQNSGEIVLIPSGLRNKLVDLRQQQAKITNDESLDNSGKTGILERLSMLIGSLSFQERLEHQLELKSSLNVDININEIILALEAVQDWMNFSELKTIRLLRDLQEEIDVVEDLILNEVNNQ